MRPFYNLFGTTCHKSFLVNDPLPWIDFILLLPHCDRLKWNPSTVHASEVLRLEINAHSSRKGIVISDWLTECHPKQVDPIDWQNNELIRPSINPGCCPITLLSPQQPTVHGEQSSGISLENIVNFYSCSLWAHSECEWHSIKSTHKWWTSCIVSWAISMQAIGRWFL